MDVARGEQGLQRQQPILASDRGRKDAIGQPYNHLIDHMVIAANPFCEKGIVRLPLPAHLQPTAQRRHAIIQPGGAVDQEGIGQVGAALNYPDADASSIIGDAQQNAFEPHLAPALTQQFNLSRRDLLECVERAFEPHRLIGLGNAFLKFGGRGCQHRIESLVIGADLPGALTTRCGWRSDHCAINFNSGQFFRTGALHCQAKSADKEQQKKQQPEPGKPPGLCRLAGSGRNGWVGDNSVFVHTLLSHFIHIKRR